MADKNKKAKQVDLEEMAAELAKKTPEEVIQVALDLQKQNNFQKQLIEDLKEERLQKEEKPDFSGKIFVKNSAGKKVQFIGKKHLYKGQVITAEYLYENPGLVDELQKLKVGFLI